MKIVIVTDSSAGFLEEECQKYKNLRILDIPFFINDKEHIEGKTIDRDEFFNKLDEPNTVVHTSQPTISSLINLWTEILKVYEYVIQITISSGLSSSYSTAQMISNEDEFLNHVFVVDCQRVSFSLKIAVLEALKMIDLGFSAVEIVKYLTKTKFDTSIYLNVPNLKYLVKGGRLTKSVAAIANLFKIKPVLQIQGDKLDMYKKAHSIKQCYQIQIKALKEDLETRFKDYYLRNEMVLGIAYSSNVEEALNVKKMLEEEFSNLKIFLFDKLCLTIACHIGRDVVGVGVCRIRKELLG